MKMPVKVVPVTSDELKAYAELMRGNTSKKPKDFCEYLKGQHRSKVDVIADLSGVTFSELNLRHIDLGNIIACKKDEHPTQFQECVLEGTKFRSTQPAEGLAFTDCKNMKNASFEMDLMGVNFGKDSDITGVDFRKAHNIDKVIIDPACVVSAVQLDFPNADILKAHMGVNIQKQREAEKAAVEAQQQAELFRGYLEEERNQAAGTEETARVQKQSWGEYLAENLGATPREVVVNVAKGVARGAKEVVVGNARLAAEAAGDIVGAIFVSILSNKEK